MPKKETTKIKTAISIDIRLNKAIEKIIKKSGEKKSTYINNILLSQVLGENFKTADQLLKENKK